MTLLENEITQKNVELAKKSPELLNRHEHEVKLVPTSAETFQEYREVAVPIEQSMLNAYGEEFAPLVISTDDYHFGKTHLDSTHGAPWTEWDDPRTYNTAELARDLEGLKQGASLIRRHFSFETEEPVFDDETVGSPFVLIEGLYAGSKDLAEVRDLHFELPTGIATGIGRDIRRLIVENRANRAFPTPESRLRYQIETALPLYLAQERPSRNSFSESLRPLAERAVMLSNL